MLEREQKKRADQNRHERELKAIRDDNHGARHEAQVAQKNQYRTSGDQKSTSFNPKKIEEEYSMFDEQQAEEELEDIIEQPIEEESCEGDSEDEFNTAMAGDANA